MNELYRLMRTYAYGLWRYKWLILVMTWVLFLGGAAFVLAMPNQYEAKASFFINTKSVMKPLLHGLAIQQDVTGHLGTVTKVVLSRPNLEAVVKETSLDLRVHDDFDLEAMTQSLEKKIKISGRRRENVYDITYEDNDPEVAYEVVEVILNNVLEKVLAKNRDDNNVAQKFLLDQIKEHEERLTQAEKRLADFKKVNIGLMPGRTGYYGNLQRAEEDLASSQFQLRLAVEKLGALRQQIRSEQTPTAETAAMRTRSSPLALQISALKTQLNDALFKYTDIHPQVVSLKETIKDLEQKLESERQNALVNPGAFAISETDPVYQTISIELNRAEVEVASLRRQVSEHQSRVATLKKSADTIPEVEAQLARLNRDYDVVKAQYETLLGRFEKAKLSEEADNSDKDVKFQVIEPPIVPISPVGPYRALFLAVVLMISLGVSVGIAFILDQVRPVFYDSDSLSRRTGIPVLGTVPMEWKGSAATAQKLSNTSILALTGLLLITFAIVMVNADMGAAYLAHLIPGK